jgi:hypothetical protein
MGLFQSKEPTSKKILSTGGQIAAIALALFGGFAYVVRSLKNVKLSLHLKLKRDDRDKK